MSRILICFTLLCMSWTSLNAQIPDSCKLSIGTNMSGMFDWSTELPFVDMMHHAREWYTKSIDDPNYPWNSEMADHLEYRADGYPTQIPQTVEASIYDQQSATIWAITDAWPIGTYTVLFDGSGELSFSGNLINFEASGDRRYTFDMVNPIGGAVEMIITRSEKDDPIHNIRVLMPDTEATYQEQPFYGKWLEKIQDFPTIRFMDWGQTNNWGNDQPGTDEPLEYWTWEDRSHMDHYTWATNKGVPYEMMITLMNSLEKDGWVCVPHRAGEQYQRSMARLFKDNLDSERHLYVEYSNEIWNWIFDQTHWLNKWGCEETGTPWPEGIVPFVQNTLNYWTSEYEDELDKITRVVGVFTAWTDVSNRIVYNLDPQSFDAVSPTFYIGLNEEQDAILDGLGSNATAEDIIGYAFENIPQVLEWIDDMSAIADSLDKRMVFYEGGQHLTPHPFGIEPTYDQALLDVQRSPMMYELYDVWLDSLRKYQRGDDPLLLMSFGFVGGRSAQYGSWGVLETIDQDTSVIPAPKYRAILDNMARCDQVSSTTTEAPQTNSVNLYPNPANRYIKVKSDVDLSHAIIRNIQGEVVATNTVQEDDIIKLHTLPKGLYFIQLIDQNRNVFSTEKIIIFQE